MNKSLLFFILFVFSFPASTFCQSCDSIIVTLPATQMFMCSDNDENTLTPIVESNIDNLDFQWSTNDGSFANPNMLDSASVNILGIGTYILMTSAPDSNCFQVDTIVVTPTILPNLNAGEDTTLFCQIPNYFSLSGSTDATEFISPLWSTVNGEITFGAATFQPNISEPGIYILNLLDQTSNCLLSDTVEVSLHSVLIDSLSVTEADCDQTNGTATVYSTANPADLIVNWSSGATTATATDLAPGSYTVTVMDGNCMQEGIVFVEESEVCEVTIRGQVYQAITSICNPDVSQLDWVSDIMTVRLMPLNLEITAPMADFSYEFVVPPGDYTIIMNNGPAGPPNTFGVLCPADNSIDVSLPLAGNISDGNDFYWQLTVSTNDFDKEINPLKISPNPNHGQFQINYTLPVSTQATLKVFSISSKLTVPIFENKNLKAGNYTDNLDLEHLPNGVYLIRLETEKAVFYERVIKQ